MPAVIVARHVSKYYGAHAAVSDLSFEIQQGEVVGLLGLNGAGKTTTLRLLSGLLFPTSGRVWIEGFDLATEPEAAHARIGFLPETPPLYAEMTVKDYLLFVGKIRAMGAHLPKALQTTLAATDLVDVADERIGILSHGFKRRVGIAQAIIHDPKVILLDEPTGGLDPIQVVHMRQLVRNLKGRHTVIVSSHVLSEIHQVCDRILVMDEGRIAHEGTETELARRTGQTTHANIEVTQGAEMLRGVLAQLDYLEVLQIEPLDAAHGGGSHALVSMPVDRRVDLAKYLIGKNLSLVELHRVHQELEDIFLALTQGNKAQPHAVKRARHNKDTGHTTHA